MKFKIFISSLILFFSFFASNLHAKLLPPGTGTQADVPSNLLILLDKSGSMGWRMSNAQSINRMMDGVTDSSGLRERWLSFSKDIRQKPPIIAVYTKSLLKNGASREAEKLPPRKLGKPKSKRRDPFEGLSTRELYMCRPMD